MVSVTGGKQFTKLDLRAAYQQMPLDAEAAKLVTINTHQGLYEFTKLPFGVSSAPAIFQRAMDGILQGMSHVICYLDDILVTGTTEEEHMRNLEEVLRRLKEHGITLKREKCFFFKDAVQYLGRVIDAKGIHTSRAKLQAVLDAPSPTNVRELRSVLGMINYYIKFLPDLSTLLHPLHSLLRDNQRWVWSEACQRAFTEVKQRLTRAPVLAHYDPDVPLVLAADASAYGLGAVISHQWADGTERPIAFASRTLSSSERNYPQVEKEALSLVFGIRKFHQYVYGRSFTLVTDHQPLTTIFGPKRGIPTLAAVHMQRWALLLSGYTYNIRYRSTLAHANADGLSRVPLPAVELEESTSVHHLVEDLPMPVLASEITTATRVDAKLSKVIMCCQKGWPPKPPEGLEPFWRKRDELTTEGDCLLWGSRVVVPTKLRDKVLKELHQGHPGIVKMKQVARSCVWWPGIDKQLEGVAKTCVPCQSNAHSPPKAPLQVWPWPTTPWERIHVDFLGPFLGKMIFIAVDAHSKWPVAYIMPSTTAAQTIEVLREMFARNGLPKQLVSDNGPQFRADEFRQFLSRNGVQHTLTPPYHPASNGAAERFVQTIKQSLRASHHSGTPLSQALATFLLRYRSTPHCTMGVAPCMLFCNRRLRTRLDLLAPDMATRVQRQQDKQKQHHDRHSHYRELEVGQTVWARNFQQGSRWKRGVISDRLGPRSYLIELDGGELWRRHLDHIRVGTPDTTQESRETTAEENWDFQPEKDLPQAQVQEEELAEHPIEEEEEERSEDVATAPLTIPTPPSLGGEEATTHEEANMRRYPTRNRSKPERLYGTLNI